MQHFQTHLCSKLQKPLKILSPHFLLLLLLLLLLYFRYLCKQMRDSSLQSLLSLSWPTRKDEPFRFTDTSFIKSSKIQPITNPPQDFDFSSILLDTHLLNLTIIDGYIVDSLSGLSGLPEGVFLGSLSKLSSEGIVKRVSEFVGIIDGDLFWSLNGVGTPDLIVVYVPEGCRIETPLYLTYCSMKGSEFGLNI